jgi:hypothetical protein
MKIGVVGLPNVGKSTLFNALTRNAVASANYPFCTIEPNVGIVAVPDARVDFLAKHYKAKSVINATVEFVDIAGLVKGASGGEGLGNKFLGHIREADAIVHVVRVFDRSEITHVSGDINPERDIDTINLELILADLESVNKRLDKNRNTEEVKVLEKIKTDLENEKFAGVVGKQFNLITSKPMIYVINVDEKDVAKDFGDKIPICAKIEEELSQITDAEERKELMQAYGLKTSGLDKLIAKGYETLGLISFLTAGEPEVRAWTVTKGAKAPQAAGKIHTDFERGFIRAEVVAYDDFVKAGSILKAKEKGLVRSEGKDYIVKDGDVIHFKFNV